MPLLRNRGFVAAAIIVLVLSAGLLLARDNGDGDHTVVATVKRGEFKVTVTTSGELSARESVRITAPPNARQVGQYQMQIASIVPEGTIVNEGDVVAEIDRSALAAKLAEETLALEKAQAVYEQAMLDSTLTLSQAREQIRSYELALEEKRLAKEQAVYEPPTIQRQAEIDLEKAIRTFEQSKEDYKTQTDQAKAKMREVGADLQRTRNELKIVQEVMEGFTVKAPASGMVIYVKEWNGRKRTTGSQVSSWDPAVATLPDLTQMESITYVNEIDIRKVAVGQPVELTLDSDPSKLLTGTVTAVANVGEQRPNTDSKVFEVKIKVEQPDTTLRPGMTTGNKIETSRSEDVLFVPIEALSSEDGIPFVYQHDGGVKKVEVITGAMNENEVVIVDGLEEGDRVLLTPPPNGDELEIERLPNSPVIAPAEVGDSTPVAGGDTAITQEPLPLEERSPTQK